MPGSKLKKPTNARVVALPVIPHAQISIAMLVMLLPIPETS